MKLNMTVKKEAEIFHFGRLNLRAKLIILAFHYEKCVKTSQNE